MLLLGFKLCCLSCWPAPFLAEASSLPLLNKGPLSASLASPSPSLFAATLVLPHLVKGWPPAQEVRVRRCKWLSGCRSLKD